MPQNTKRKLFSTATANKQRELPKFQAPKKTPENSRAYVDQLDPLLKLNRGGFTAIGSDASSNIPFAVTGAEPVAVKNATEPQATVYNEGGNPYQIQDSNVVLPEKPDLPVNPITNQPADSNVTIDQFMSQIDKVLQDSGVGSNQTPQLPNNGATGIASTPDGGVLFDDGIIRYEDGTQREYTGQQAEAIQSMVDGSIRYSDGSIRSKSPEPGYGIASTANNTVRYSDGTYHNGPYLITQGENLPGGTRGLISGIFGQDQAITQPYGNVNPMEPTPGHVNLGTDIRTRDLSGTQRDLKLPVEAKVIQMYKDDGTRFGDQSGHKGYGNSLLLQLPSGEMLRFSHLSKVLDVQPGDTIRAGEVFGNPGTTGNTAGEHLDLEYYNKDGRIDNPVNFSGFTDPKTILPNQPTPGALTANPNQSQSTVQPQQAQQTQVQPQQQMRMPVTDAITSVVNGAGNMVQNAAVGADKVAANTANAIDKLNPTGSFDLGGTETLKGDYAGAAEKQRNTIANVGTAIGAPELQTNELSKSQGTNPFRQLAGNLLDVASTPLKKIGVPDLGITEAIAGGKTVNTDAALAPQSYAYDAAGNQVASKAPTAQDYADTLGKNLGDVGNSIKTTFSDAVAKPMEGIAKLKDEFQTGVADASQGLTDTLLKIGVKRKVGEDSGGNQNILGAPQSAPGKNDIRDPFFKLGGAETYGSFINKDKIGDGGLSLDLFTPDFFKDASNISNVFGSTHLIGQAQDKFKANEAAKYPKMSTVGYSGLMDKMGYQDGYDRGEIDNYNKQVDEYNNSVKSSIDQYNKQVNDYNSSIDSYLAGINLKTDNPTYAETPRSSQSVIPGTNFSPNVTVSEQRATATPNLFSNAFSVAPFDFSNSPTAGASAKLSPAAINASLFSGKSPTALAINSMSIAAPQKQAPVQSQPSAPSVSIPQAQSIGQQTGSGVPSIKTPTKTVSAPSGTTLRADSGGSIQAVPKATATLPNKAVVNLSTPVKTPSAQLAQPAKSSSTPAKASTNIFSKAVNAVKKLFRK